MEKASLEDALEEKLESIEESHNEIIAKIIKEQIGRASCRERVYVLV